MPEKLVAPLSDDQILGDTAVRNWCGSLDIVALQRQRTLVINPIYVLSCIVLEMIEVWPRDPVNFEFSWLG